MGILNGYRTHPDYPPAKGHHLPDGEKELSANIELLNILKTIGAEDVLVSISNQGDFAIAIAQLIKKE